MSTKMNDYEQSFVDEEKHLDIWDVLPSRLQKREGEDKKAYNKRINSEFLWITSVENIDWQSLQVTIDDISDVKKAAKVLGIQLEDDDVIKFENGYTDFQYRLRNKLNQDYIGMNNF